MFWTASSTGTEILNHIILFPLYMTMHFYFLFTMNDHAKNTKIQTTKSAPTFWAISPVWTELLTCKRRLKIFNIWDFSDIFLKVISGLGWLPGLCRVGVHHSPYTHSGTLGLAVFLDATLLCRNQVVGFYISFLILVCAAYKLPCSKICFPPHYPFVS